jgi:protein TonB
MQNGRKVVYEVKHEISFGMNGQQDVSKNTKAEFPGGIQAWKNYLEKNLNADVLAMNRAPSGNYSATIAFDVNKQGEISNLKAETKQGFGTEEESIRIIKSGPKWVPAKQDGRFVDSHVKQTITFMVTE